jgi:hypothetical protein
VNIAWRCEPGWGVRRTCNKRPPPLHALRAQGEGKSNLVLAAHFLRPSCAKPPSHERFASPARDPEKCCCGFRTRSCANKQGSGAPKGALSNQCPHRRQVYAVCVTHLCAAARCFVVRRARLPALTLAALATSSTRWLSSRTGFPAAFANGGFARFAEKLAAVKHAPCGPVLVPVDRGPRAARERIGKKTKKSARGHRASPSLLRHAVRNGALHKARYFTV